jgi:hypothetical protein
MEKKRVMNDVFDENREKGVVISECKSDDSFPMRIYKVLDILQSDSDFLIIF